MTDEQWMPGNKEELMTAIEREWNLLIKLAESLIDEQMSTPDEGGWSPKDNLAHIAEWMNIFMGYHMDRRPAREVMGMDEETVRGWDMEKINPALFERNRNRPRGDVMGMLKQAYAGLEAKLEAMPFEDFLKPRHADDPEKRPLLLWALGDTTEHFQEHRETIEKGIK